MLNEVDTQLTIIDIAHRFPRYIQNRWKTTAIDHKRVNGTYPTIDVFVKFVRTVAEEVNDPVYGHFDDKVNCSSGGQRRSHSRSFYTDVNNAVRPRNSVLKPPNVAANHGQREVTRLSINCILCNHRLFGCNVFKSMKPVERLQFVKQNKLCENCLMSNHTTDDCRKPGRCTVCNAKHTRFIHIENVSQGLNESTSNPSLNNVTNSNAVHVNGECGPTRLSESCNNVPSTGKQVLLPLVNVTINETYSTYALLDTASTGSFCTINLVKSLGISGKKVILNMNTLSQSREQETEAVSLKVCGNGGTLYMSNVYTVDSIPVSNSCMNFHHKHLSGIPVPDYSNIQVDLLIGQDCSDALIPLEVKRGAEGEPYAVRTVLGWSISGPVVYDKGKQPVISHFIKLDKQVEKMWELDNELLCDDRAMSQNDQLVVNFWEKQGQLCSGSYEIPIPWIDTLNETTLKLSDNKIQALKRFHLLEKRLSRDDLLCKKYTDGIQTLIDKKYAEKVPSSHLNGTNGCVHYLPHHPVISPNKDKIRIVFDCSAKYEDFSLNDYALQGPDLTNKLTAVLLRFREHEIAVAGDIEAMYHQVKVPVHDRDALRFLWHEGNEVVEYRMTVHPFGAVWSSSAANYALRKTADDNHESYEPCVALSVHKDFYVDDWLKSIDGEQNAISLTRDVTELLGHGGFRLTKLISTNKAVLKSIPVEERRKDLSDFNIDKHELPQDRALGISWDTASDTFYFKLNSMSKPHTRRGVISVVSSVFDPLGFVSPVIIAGKMIFQELTKLKLGWDDSIPDNLLQKWQKWLAELYSLETVKVPRCVIPGKCKSPFVLQLHHFSDASQSAYGTVTYLRIIDDKGQVHVSFLFSKSKLAPIKVMNIPRLELTAAVLAAKVDKKLRSELSLTVDQSFFWCDSEIVLQYIQNRSRRFHVFVANRIAAIHQTSQPSQWRHVPGIVNPADNVTRGVSASKLHETNWFCGPLFLQFPESEWPNYSVKDLHDNDPEVKEVHASVIQVANDPLDLLMKRCSSFYALKRLIGWLLLFVRFLPSKLPNQDFFKTGLTVKTLTEAERAIIKHVQKCCFSDELNCLVQCKVVKTSSMLSKLQPFLHDGLICVGGRFKYSSLPRSIRHQVIIPKKSLLG